MPTGTRHDPHPRFQFSVEIDGMVSSNFTEVSGLEFETEVIEYRDGNEPSTTRKLPGLTKFDAVTLSRGFTGNHDLWDWVRSISQGTLDRRNVAIVLLDTAMQPVLRWTLRNALPTKWIGPTLDASESDVMMETIVLVHEGLEMETA